MNTNIQILRSLLLYYYMHIKWAFWDIFAQNTVIGMYA